MLRSVRFRITALATVVVAVVLVVVTISLLEVQRSQLTDNLDASLARRADDVESLLVAADNDASGVLLVNGAGDDALVQIVTLEGEVLAATANADAAPIAAVPDGGADELSTSKEIPAEDDEYRVLSRRLTTATGEVVVHVAQNTDDRNELIARLRTAALVVVPVAVLILAAAVWWLVGRTLRPVEDIRAEVERIGGRELNRRVPAPNTGDEIDRLAVTMNDLLDRLQRASAQQQRFVADASHELRSPLTRMRTELEVESRAPAEERRPVEEVTESVVAEIDELTALVDDLLVLARLDAGEEGARETFDLDDVVLEETRRVARGDVSVDASSVSAAPVRGDRGEMRRVVRNLLDNAVRHASTSVAVGLGQLDTGIVELTVADDGPGIPQSDRESVFERFGRVESDRGRGSGGIGLGLAITREIVVRHGGSVAIEQSPLGGAEFTVRLPSGS